MPLGTEVGLGPGDILLDGDPQLPPNGKGHSSPHVSAHVYCDQTVAHLSNCMLSCCFTSVMHIVVVNIFQKILKTFDSWQQTIEKLASQCNSLPPITVDATKFDENIATQAKCWLQTKAVSAIL